MNRPRYFFLIFLALTLGSAIGALAAAPKRKPAESDLATIEVRRASVDLAANLAKVENPEPLVASALPRPFNPAGFNVTAHVETPVTAATGPVAKNYGDREILIALAAKVTPGGTFSLGSQSRLSFGKRYLRPGDHLTVNYEGQDYVLELVGFDTTNFVLRLNKEEITRPIKPGKNQ